MLLCGFLIFLPLFTAHSQIRLDNWQTYSSLKDIRGAVADSRGRIWAATSGGLFVYTPETGDFQEFRNTNGLLTLDINAIQADTINKKIYLGAVDGTIDIVDEDFQFAHILDIAQSTAITRHQINDILIRDSIAYIAGDFGIAVLNLKQKVFIETIERIGTFQPGISVRKLILINDTLWAGTEEGVGRASLNAKTLRSPESWEVFKKEQGLPDNPVVSIAQIGGVIYAANSGAISRFENGMFVKESVAPEGINSLSAMDSTLYYTDQFNLFKSPDVRISFKEETFGTISGQAVLPSLGSVIVFFKTIGAALIKGSDTTYITPNTPTINEFLQLALDRDGNLWNVSNAKPEIEAFSVLKDGTWEIFNNRNYPVLGTQTFYRVSIGPDGSVWVSGYGSGLGQVKILPDSYEVTKYDTTNTPVRGISINSGYVVMGQTATDNSGTLWAVNRFSPTSQLVARTSQGKFYTYQSSIPATDRNFLAMAIDGSGTKWLGSAEGRGLYWFNENGTLENTSDDREGILTTLNSLPDNTQSSLVIDRNGALWIGTPTGLAVMFNPSAVRDNATPSIRRIIPLIGQSVNDVVVDALNNKWVATRNGVYVLNEDGTEVLTIIKADSLPLADNDVQSIAINNSTGKIYFGTKKGLSTASTLSIMPLSDYAIETFPQPFYPVRDGELTISGLAPDSHVRILTPGGELIRAFDTKGERIVWDGFTSTGTEAPSGVYIISAISRSAGISSAGKLTLVRK